MTMAKKLIALALLSAVASAWGAERKIFGTPIPVPGSGEDAMALCLEGSCLYTGERGTICVYDVKEPLKPKRLGSVSGLGGVRQVAVQKGMAYVSTREYGLWIVDCTNPRKPRIRSRFDCCELATGVDVAGDVVFLGQRQNGVEFIDVSDPDHPAHIAMRKTDESQSVKYRDGYVYSGDWGTGKLTVFDAHDMKNIRQVAYVDLWGYGDGVWLKGKYLYAATGHHSKHRDPATLPYKPVDTPEIRKYGKLDAGSGCGHGMDIFDISDPTAPKRLGRVDYPPFYARGLDMWTPRTSANSDIVFSAQTHNGIFAVDCSDPMKPVVLDRWVSPVADKPQWPSCCIGSIAVGNGCVYVAGKGCGVVVIPAEGAAQEVFQQGVLPQNASFREAYPTDENEFYVWKPAKPGQARGVALKGDIVYAACGDAGLHVLRILPSGGFKKIGEQPGHDRVFDVVFDGKYLYTAEGLDGWGFYELVGDTEFREVGRVKNLGASNLNLGLCVWAPAPGFAGLSARMHGNYIYDVSNIAKPRQLAKVGGCPGWDKYLMDQAIGGGRYLANNGANSYLEWVDLQAKPHAKVCTKTDKNRIFLSNGICRFSDDKALATRGDEYLFLAPNEGDPADGSKWVGKKFPGKSFNGIPRCNGKGLVALTCRIRRKVALFDFTDLEHPKQLKYWDVSGNPDYGTFYKDKLLIPCGHQGVLLQK